MRPRKADKQNNHYKLFQNTQATVQHIATEHRMPLVRIYMGLLLLAYNRMDQVSKVNRRNWGFSGHNVSYTMHLF